MNMGLSERDTGVRENVSWVGALTLVMILGILALALYAWTVPALPEPKATGWSIFACGSLLALAATLVGGLIGFTFGIPKAVKVEPPAGGAAAVADNRKADYRANSNFEEISDWLTKILVGAGLVQLGAIPEAVDTFAKRVGDSGSLGAYGAIIAPSIVIAYAIAGFGIAYLWSRIYMGRELEEADHDHDDGGASTAKATAEVQRE